VRWRTSRGVFAGKSCGRVGYNVFLHHPGQTPGGDIDRLPSPYAPSVFTLKAPSIGAAPANATPANPKLADFKKSLRSVGVFDPKNSS
jgi:hypothetical protein